MSQSAIEVRSELNGRAARKAGAHNASEVFERIRGAFELFDNQSVLLQRSFDSLKESLARANRELNAKNRILGEKVRELQQVTSRLQCILESIGDGVLVINDEMRIEHCNSAAEALLGMKRMAIEKRPYSEVMNGLGNEGALHSAMERGVACLHEQRTRTGENGSKIHVVASVSPIRSPGGLILGAVEALQDVTHIRFLEERMHHQKRMVALGEMAASVAHEIRNPLGTIEGFARLLRQDLEKEGAAQHSRLASKIIEGAQNLNYVIMNLLTYVRPMTLQCDRFEVGALMDSVEELLAGSAAGLGVSLVVRKAGAAGVSGDVRQIRQVLVNLGRNAIEACEKGSGRVTISYSDAGRDAFFIVSDNGCGICEEDMPRVFDPFFTRKEGGTGLGLALCHKIVSAHGGEININSSKGRGTVAKVILPQIGESR